MESRSFFSSFSTLTFEKSAKRILTVLTTAPGQLSSWKAKIEISAHKGESQSRPSLRMEMILPPLRPGSFQ